MTRLQILNSLSTHSGKNNELFNIKLAEKIVANDDYSAVKILVELLAEKNKSIQSDCIKVLYETGQRNPDMIADYVNIFISLLRSGNNRIQWGAMTALRYISRIEPKKIHSALDAIITTANNGSVITRDHAVGILTELMKYKKFADDCFELLCEQLMSCPPNQLPMYAENARSVITPAMVKRFRQILEARLNDFEKESKRRRVEKVIRQITT